MRIGEVARRTGATTKTIRYYESIGLLPEPARAANGYRDYREDAVDRLAFIRDAQASGLTLTEIAAILELRGRGESTCRHVIELLDRHVEAVERQIETLQETRERLVALAEGARSLDPDDCTDPNRCQTISDVDTPHRVPRGTGRRLHGAPVGHRH